MSNQPCAFCLIAGTVVPEDEFVFRRCVLCDRYMCEVHQSKVDPDYCTDCMSDINQVDFEKTETKFTGSTGEIKTHEGFRPVGDFWITSPGAIAAAPDDRLKRMFEFYSRRVHDAERIKDRQIVIRGMVAMEMEERAAKRGRPQRGIKLSTPTGDVFLSDEDKQSYATKPTGNGSSAAKRAKAPAPKPLTPLELGQQLKAAGLTLSKLDEILAKLKVKKDGG